MHSPTRTTLTSTKLYHNQSCNALEELEPAVVATTIAGSVSTALGANRLNGHEGSAAYPYEGPNSQGVQSDELPATPTDVDPDTATRRVSADFISVHDDATTAVVTAELGAVITPPPEPGTTPKLHAGLGYEDSPVVNQSN